MDSRHDLCRSQVQPDPRPMAQGLGRGGQQLDGGLEHIGGLPAILPSHQDLAAMNLAPLDPRQPHRQPLPRLAGHQGRAMRLETPDPALQPGGEQLDQVAHLEHARPGGSSDHGPGALEGEHPVHREPGQIRGLARSRGFTRGDGDPGTQLANADGRPCGDGHRRAETDRTPGEPARHLLPHQLQPLRLHQVGLGDHRDPARHPELLQHREVLTRLGHDPLVGGDDQQREVHPGRAGCHGPDQVLVPGHIHHTEHGAIVQRQRGEVQVEGDPPPPLLGEGVHGPPG